ncbi:MAG: hypothetical protein ACK5DE_03925 [Bacteroidota bacterium]|jgi:hypothetical protein
MTKTIELFDKVVIGDGMMSLIAECNGYEDGLLVIQFSRSPFIFPETMTDQEIIDSLWLNEYSIYL